MATITITRTQVCPANNHVTLAVSGDRSTTIRTSIDEMLEPVTPSDIEAAIKVLLKLHSSGKTRAQMRAALLAGITVTTVSA